jgi:hypothetical protein
MSDEEVVVGEEEPDDDVVFGDKDPEDAIDEEADAGE